MTGYVPNARIYQDIADHIVQMAEDITTDRLYVKGCVYIESVIENDSFMGNAFRSRIDKTSGIFYKDHSILRRRSYVLKALYYRWLCILVKHRLSQGLYQND